MTDKEIHLAYSLWLRDYPHYELDHDLEPLLQFKSYGDWIKTARQALFLSSATVAKRMDISSPTYTKLERREKLGTLSIHSLRKAAEALDCDLIYIFRPKEKVRFSQLAWRQLLPFALEHPWLNNCDPKRKPQALAAAARWKMRESKVRKQLQWALR